VAHPEHDEEHVKKGWHKGAKKTNQFLQKALRTRLLHANVASTRIMQLTGDKNVYSINNHPKYLK